LRSRRRIFQPAAANNLLTLLDDLGISRRVDDYNPRLVSCANSAIRGWIRHIKCNGK
jgi:hypothetical protein